MHIHQPCLCRIHIHWVDISECNMTFTCPSQFLHVPVHFRPFNARCRPLYIRGFGFPAKAMTFCVLLPIMSYVVMSSALCNSPTSFEHSAYRKKKIESIKKIIAIAILIQFYPTTSCCCCCCCFFLKFVDSCITDGFLFQNT